MAKHDFGIMKTDPDPHMRFDTYEPEKYGCISVQDDLIEPLLERLSGVDCFWHTLERPEKGLAYCGITLIPPSSVRQFIPCLGEEAELDKLKRLLLKAEAEDRFIIHFGI